MTLAMRSYAGDADHAAMRDLLLTAPNPFETYPHGKGGTYLLSLPSRRLSGRRFREASRPFARFPTAKASQTCGRVSSYLLVTMVLSGLGPVMIPPDHLPGVLVALGRLSPATYAASALRQALIGPVTEQIIADLAVLVGLAGVIFWLVGRKMDWRQS